MELSALRTPPLAQPDAYGPVGRSAWMDVDWREHLRWVRVGSDVVNVVDLGDAGRPAIVFVHGLSGCWRNWLENLLPFAADHRVVALDLPGFGASPPPADPVSIPGYARLLDGLLDVLGIGSAVMVGNSMGGLIAAEMALDHPERVDRLVLVAAAGLTPTDRFNPRALEALQRLERGVRFTGERMSAHAAGIARRRRLRRAAFALVAEDPERLPCALVAEQLTAAGRPGLLPAGEAVLTHPIRDRLGDIACPTLVVWGTCDRLVPVRDAGEFARRIPGARSAIYPATGHVPQLERPARFNADLRAFLSR